MSDPVDVSVGRQIRLLRQQRDLSQTALADSIGVTFQQVQKYEKGSNRVSASRLVQIAKVLGADVSVFFKGIEMPESNNDNLPSGELFTRQGLALLKAFHAIKDNRLRLKMLALLQAVAHSTVDDGEPEAPPAS
ncbi:helix-turn-helix domain-containing protein [Rhizobium sp. LjRoot254]|uniref:helix-turn-helix domain-containing protein n=1 Tax=Rhizobium sp. LjRoot254 TaxID=3342297 RepID=UPI003ECDF905